MERVLNVIQQRAELFPNQTAIISGGEQPWTLSNNTLLEKINEAERFLISAQVVRLGIYMDNCAEWIIFDLAAAKLGVAVIPLPLFFTQSQIEHVLTEANVDAVVSTNPFNRLLGHLANKPSTSTATPFKGVSLTYFPQVQAKPIHGLAKVTFTSGSTGNPKGVCLSYENIDITCDSLLTQMIKSPELDDVRHLCVLPLATLLENIAGVYLALIRGGTIVTEPLQAIGFTSNVTFDCKKLLAKFIEHQIGSAILFPQILENLVKYDSQLVSSSCKYLKFVAVGGGSISNDVLELAERLSLPIYQGYGLSECCSVVCLNLPGFNKIGSVGRPLKHANVSIAEDGEIIIHGHAMMGYLGDIFQCADTPSNSQITQSLHTGDIGYIDADGYLYVAGRKKNILVSSFGRNISPEWVESVLTAQPEIDQAAVFGDSQAELSAVIVSSHQSDKAIETALSRCNSSLPDYARIGRWVKSDQRFSPAHNTLTHNGRLKRDHIAQLFESAINTRLHQA